MSTTISDKLRQRCNDICELCNTETAALAYAVSPRNNDVIENEVALCNTCASAIDNENMAMDWHCLAGSIWNTEPSVQALSYRLLYKHKAEEWASEIMSSVDLDETVVQWGLNAFEVSPVHRDSNGTELNNGDTIVLIQGLNVKGANFMAPKGAIVRKIKLVPDNTDQIEGKINEQTIVILTKYVRKS
ncbi:alkylphosphonate utilization protein [Polluticoccus soli]|uniref:alkylphosphonate utilization protein n=1 Tax=Polluticoccus soli TaxID=3034150 RepID=UPI0023E23877|nr:alkylphosphonate utilization protein [Flavipsychrobacter sp. JY13-12]